jgi:hypothetical protein
LGLWLYFPFTGDIHKMMFNKQSDSDKFQGVSD